MLAKFTYSKKGGYIPEEVDNYISSLEAELKAYKEKDEAIKNAFINAQIAADCLLISARQKSDEIVKNAYTKLDEIHSAMSNLREFIKNFNNDYNSTVSKYIHGISEADLKPIYSQMNSFEEHLADIRKSL